LERRVERGFKEKEEVLSKQKKLSKQFQKFDNRES
jgi:hypothetical protein